VIITFDPRTFRKKRHDLREKLEKVRTTLYELRRKYRERQPAWKDPKAVEAHYQKLCETLHITPKVFRLSFYTDNGPQMSFALNRYQMESHLRRFAKTIIVTDHHDWSREAIYQAQMVRHLLEDQFRRAKNRFHVALMPQYHWTDSKIRIHVFVCVAALTYLTLLHHRLVRAGLDLSVRQAMQELRAVRTAIYWLADERKPRRILEKPTDQQIAILKALGYHVKAARVPQK
jgi:transposase